MKTLSKNKPTKTMFELTDEEIALLVINGNIRRFPDDFWDGVDGYQRAGNVVKYLVEQVLKLDQETLIKEYSKKLLLENKLKSLLDKVFDGDEIEAILAAYPELKNKSIEVLKDIKDLTFRNEKIPTKDEIKEKYSEDLIKFYFKSFQNLNLKLKNDYTRQELIDILNEKKQKLGRNPTNLEMKVPQAIIFIREFDTTNWQEILQKAGI